MSSGHSYGATDAGASQNLKQLNHYNVTYNNKQRTDHADHRTASWYALSSVCSASSISPVSLKLTVTASGHLLFSWGKLSRNTASMSCNRSTTCKFLGQQYCSGGQANFWGGMNTSPNQNNHSSGTALNFFSSTTVWLFTIYTQLPTWGIKLYEQEPAFVCYQQ